MSESGIKSTGVEACPKHPNYKGRRPTKRDCQGCKNLYKALRVNEDKNKPFRSIFSPDFKVSLFHLLAEIACYQRFGNLPPYFWRKGTTCRQDAKDHYQKTYKMLLVWRKKKIPARNGTWNPIEAMNQLFFYLSGHDKEMDDMMIKKIKLVKEESKQRRTTTEAIDFGSSKKRSRFQGLKDLGGEGGEEG